MSTHTNMTVNFPAINPKRFTQTIILPFGRKLKDFDEWSPLYTEVVTPYGIIYKEKRFARIEEHPRPPTQLSSRVLERGTVRTVEKRDARAVKSAPAHGRAGHTDDEASSDDGMHDEPDPRRLSRAKTARHRANHSPPLPQHGGTRPPSVAGHHDGPGSGRPSAPVSRVSSALGHSSSSGVMAVVQSVAAGRVTDTSVEVTWVPPHGAMREDAYRVYYAAGVDPSAQLQAHGAPSTASSHTVDGLAAGTEYVFAVSIVRRGKEGPKVKAPAPVRTAPPRDVRPKKVAPGDVGDTWACVTWERPSGGSGAWADVRGFVVRVFSAPEDSKPKAKGGRPASAGAPPVASVEVGADVTSARVEGLKQGGRYTFRVACTTAAGLGAWSDKSAPVWTLDVPGRPSAPLAAASKDGPGVELSWSTPSDGHAAIAGYGVQVAPAGSSAWEDCVSDTGDGQTAASLALAQLPAAATQGRGVVFRVRARNSVGWGEWSEAGAAHLVALPKPPAKSEASSSSSSRKSSSSSSRKSSAKDGASQAAEEDAPYQEDFEPAGEAGPVVEAVQPPPVAVAGTTQDGATLTWAPIDGQAGRRYFVLSRPVDTIDWRIHAETCDAADGRVVVTGLSPSTLYTFCIGVESDAGDRRLESAPSEPAWTDGAPADVPEPPCIVDAGDSHVTVRVGRSVGPTTHIDGFEVQLWDAASAEASGDPSGTPAATCRVAFAAGQAAADGMLTGLAGGRAYRLRSAAFNAHGTGPFGAFSERQWTAALPPAPSGVAVVVDGHGSHLAATLTWMSPALPASGAGEATMHVTGYRVEMRAPDGDWAVAAETGRGRTSCFARVPLSEGTGVVSFRVLSVNALGAGEPSETVDVDVAAAEAAAAAAEPPAPEGDADDVWASSMARQLVAGVLWRMGYGAAEAEAGAEEAAMNAAADALAAFQQRMASIPATPSARKTAARFLMSSSLGAPGGPAPPQQPQASSEAPFLVTWTDEDNGSRAVTYRVRRSDAREFETTGRAFDPYEADMRVGVVYTFRVAAVDGDRVSAFSPAGAPITAIPTPAPASEALRCGVGAQLASAAGRLSAAMAVANDAATDSDAFVASVPAVSSAAAAVMRAASEYATSVGASGNEADGAALVRVSALAAASQSFRTAVADHLKALQQDADTGASADALAAGGATLTRLASALAHTVCGGSPWSGRYTVIKRVKGSWADAGTAEIGASAGRLFFVWDGVARGAVRQSEGESGPSLQWGGDAAGSVLLHDDDSVATGDNLPTEYRFGCRFVGQATESATGASFEIAGVRMDS